MSSSISAGKEFGTLIVQFFPNTKDTVPAIRLALADGLIDGETDGEADGLAEADPLTPADGLGLAEAEGDKDGEALGEAEADALAD